MKLYIKNRIKGKISKKDRVLQTQKSLNTITNYSSATQKNSLSESQTQKQTQRVNINVESTKAWALQAIRNHKTI